MNTSDKKLLITDQIDLNVVNTHCHCSPHVCYILASSNLDLYVDPLTTHGEQNLWYCSGHYIISMWEELQLSVVILLQNIA
jgi:hypothetical protein